MGSKMHRRHMNSLLSIEIHIHNFLNKISRRLLSYLQLTVCFLILTILPHTFALAQKISILATTFVNDFETLGLPNHNFDYKLEMQQIPSLSTLQKKRTLLLRYKKQINQINTSNLNLGEKILYDQLWYELRQQLKQVKLELKLAKDSVKINSIIKNGLASHPLGIEWYKLCVQRFTNKNISSQDLKRYGQQQVTYASKQINHLRVKMGYEDDKEGFFQYLSSDKYFVTDTLQIISSYRNRERIVRKNLTNLFKDSMIAPLNIQTWTKATHIMPPAIYNPTSRSFDFNFSTGRYNIRSMDWIFLHEGIPGHHYQLTMPQFAPLHNPFVNYEYYLGNIEGWGCYIETLGESLGLYQTDEQDLGRWEWDLVRSARVVLDVGIHVEGWSDEQAMSYWKANIKGQDEIASREINRVRSWPGQCLSYKVGSMLIMKMKDKLNRRSQFDIKKFHQAYLFLPSVPLSVVAKHIETLYKQSDILSPEL